MALPLISDLQFYIPLKRTDMIFHTHTWTTWYPRISRCLFLIMASPFMWREFLQKDLESKKSTATLSMWKRKNVSTYEIPFNAFTHDDSTSAKCFFFNQKFWNLPTRFPTVVPLEGPRSDPSLQSQNPSGPSHCQISAAGYAHCRSLPGGVCPEHIQSLGR